MNNDFFEDRKDAGVQLASMLLQLRKDKPIILALPRGGVEIGYEVAKALKAPLDVIVSRKIGSPPDPEFAIGAVSEKNTVVFDKRTLFGFGLEESRLGEEIKKTKEEVDRRIKLYRGRPLPKLAGRTVIIVDDGLATGMTALASVKSVKKEKPKRIVFAAPVCTAGPMKKLESVVDTVICKLTPKGLGSIGEYYRDFPQVSDDEVLYILHKARRA